MFYGKEIGVCFSCRVSIITVLRIIVRLEEGDDSEIEI